MKFSSQTNEPNEIYKAQGIAYYLLSSLSTALLLLSIIVPKIFTPINRCENCHFASHLMESGLFFFFILWKRKTQREQWKCSIKICYSRHIQENVLIIFFYRWIIDAESTNNVFFKDLIGFWIFLVSKKQLVDNLHWILFFFFFYIHGNFSRHYWERETAKLNFENQ